MLLTEFSTRYTILGYVIPIVYAKELSCGTLRAHTPHTLVTNSSEPQIQWQLVRYSVQTCRQWTFFTFYIQRTAG